MVIITVFIKDMSGSEKEIEVDTNDTILSLKKIWKLFLYTNF